MKIGYFVGWLVAGFIAGAAQAQVVSAQTGATAAIPVADFFRVPNLFKPVLSPDGRTVAVAVGTPSGRQRLMVMDLQDLQSSKVVAGFADADVVNYQWVNDRRLVFSVADMQSGDSPLAPGLWAVNRDGSDSRQLIKTARSFLSRLSNSIADRTLEAQWRLHSTLSDGSADVLVQGVTWNAKNEFQGFNLARLNTESGRTENLSSAVPDFVNRWVVDRNGKPAWVTTNAKGRYASYRATEQGWKLWQEADALLGTYAEPYWVGPEQELLTLARRGSDTLALFPVDSATDKVADVPLVSTPGYDFQGSLVYDSQAKKLLGVHYETDGQGTAWLDAGMRTTQAQVDRLLPGTVNRIDCTRCASAPTMLVSAFSDRQPATYYLYHRETKKLEVLGASRPWIQPSQMGLRDMFRYTARDGLSIPVLVTLPIGKAVVPRPAVVLVHGGPYVRGTHWGWEGRAQFLASRGYVVIEPEFRGSQGYGHKHFRAGWKQWGLAMQDDVADAMQWAVRQGWIDAKRVCIAGASYGGYATLMGLIKHPDLYQCGVNWVGVSDINLMYTINWSDTSDEYKKYGMPVLVGDRVADAQQLKDTSPLGQAHRLKQPLLMAYGAMDQRVPLKHGTEFRDTVSQTNPNVEWVVYASEGHGWREPGTQVDFWTRVEKFLATHIGSGVSPP